jgi:hypothetical protein
LFRFWACCSTYVLTLFRCLSNISAIFIQVLSSQIWWHLYPFPGDLCCLTFYLCWCLCHLSFQLCCSSIYLSQYWCHFSFHLGRLLLFSCSTIICNVRSIFDLTSDAHVTIFSIYVAGLFVWNMGLLHSQIITIIL